MYHKFQCVPPHRRTWQNIIGSVLSSIFDSKKLGHRGGSTHTSNVAATNVRKVKKRVPLHIKTMENPEGSMANMLIQFFVLTL